MGWYVLRKLGAAFVVIFATSVLTFVGLRVIPGDPSSVLSDEAGADAAYIEAVRHKYLLDRPLPVQYGRWAWLVLQGDLGRDNRGLPVAETIVQRIPLTLELAMLSLALGVALGVPAGVIAAVRRGKASDYAATGSALLAVSVPHFWLGLMMILLFAVELNWLPSTGYVSMRDPIGNLEHMLMPVIVLGTGLAAGLMRQTRSAMLTALGSDYVRTARAKGMSESRVIVRHALRNSLITVATIIALDFAGLVTGVVITETIFGIPGFGKLSFDAIGTRDYPMIQGIVLIVAAWWVITNLVVDVVYSVLDPRIRVEGTPA